MTAFSGIGIIGLTTMLLSCATPAERHVQQQVSEQKPTEDVAQSASQGRMRIQASEQLTDAQKIKLLDLMNRTELEVSSIKGKEGILKAALFQQISQGKFDEQEISVYKSKLTKLENQKLEIMFDNIKKVREILGKNHDINLDLEMLNIFRS